MRKAITIIGMLILAFAVKTAPAQPGPPDTLWTRTYGGYDSESCRRVRQISDGGYIITGYTESYGFGGMDVYLIRTDSIGDTVWTHTYGGSGSYDEGSSVQQTIEGGFIVAGSTNSFGAGNSDIYLIKTNAYGDTLWTKTYGGVNFEYGREIEQTNDGGYVIVGVTYSYGLGLSSIYLIKTDSLGDTVWTKTYGGSGSESGRSVMQTADGGYIIVGNTNSSGNGYYDVYLIKTDNQGNIIWQSTIGGSQNDIGYCVRQTADNGYIITGETTSYGAGRRDVYLIKTDTNGDTVWTKTYGGSETDYALEVLQTHSGDYILVGITFSFSAGYNDIYIIKTNTYGDTIWTSSIGTEYSESAYSVDELLNSGYVIGGMTSACGAGAGDIWLLRLDEIVPSLVITLSPINPPIVIQAAGGSFSFYVNIINNTNNSVDFDAWSMVMLPDSHIIGPVIYRNGFVISSHANIIRQFTQRVPRIAIPGNYMYIGNVGIFPDSVISSDGLFFIKLTEDK